MVTVNKTGTEAWSSAVHQSSRRCIVSCLLEYLFPYAVSTEIMVAHSIGKHCSFQGRNAATEKPIIPHRCVWHLLMSRLVPEPEARDDVEERMAP